MSKSYGDIPEGWRLVKDYSEPVSSDAKIWGAGWEERGAYNNRPYGSMFYYIVPIEETAEGSVPEEKLVTKKEDNMSIDKFSPNVPVGNFIPNQPQCCHQAINWTATGVTHKDLDRAIERMKREVFMGTPACETTRYQEPGIGSYLARASWRGVNGVVGYALAPAKRWIQNAIFLGCTVGGVYGGYKSYQWVKDNVEFKSPIVVVDKAE
jgi:hypothetical protein